MVAFHCGALWFYFPTSKCFSLSLEGGGVASVSISVLDIDVINLTDIIAVIIITVIYLLLLLV